MEGVSGVSGQANTWGAKSTEAQWGQELEGVGGTNNTNNGWRTNSTQDPSATQGQNNTNLDPTVEKTLGKFIGSMTIEMTKQNMNPAKKIEMDDE